jgi:hypothetical protein
MGPGARRAVGSRLALAGRISLAAMLPHIGHARDKRGVKVIAFFR